MAQSAPPPASSNAGKTPFRVEFQDKAKPANIRQTNIIAAKAVCDAIRTSLGPKGMDKMIQSGNGEVNITNDGATILKLMNVIHPVAKMLVELSRAQDVEAGDGTTTVVVLAGALLDAASNLLGKGIHPTAISESFQKAAAMGVRLLETRCAIPVELTDRETLIRIASTSLNSKVVSQNASLLAPMAVDAILRVVDNESTVRDHTGKALAEKTVNLADVRLIRKLGGTVEETELVEGLVLDNKSASDTGVKRVEKAKIGLIQFCVSPPKTDMEHNVIISDYAQMDRVLKEERQYILNIVKKIKAANCNVLLIQKSILRDAVSDLALHFFEKMKIMVVKDIEREDIEFICKTLSCKPIASLDHFSADMLASADLVEEVLCGASKVIKVTGISNPGRTVSVIVRGSNKLVLDETERSLHDALCVIRCLVKKRALVAGGGAPETELAVRLTEFCAESAAQANADATKLSGLEQYCVRAFADALEIVPYTLAENAGLNPIATVTDLRKRHADGDVQAGINVRKGAITNMLEERVVQPLLVSSSALSLASETVRCILKIDDIVAAVRL